MESKEKTSVPLENGDIKTKENLERPNRRKSLPLFDYDLDQEKREFPDEDCQSLTCPSEYTQAVEMEIGQWKSHVAEAWNERAEYVKTRREIKAKVYNESVLSAEQRDFLESVNDCFNKYIQTAEEYCKTLQIIADMSNYHNESRSELVKSSEVQTKLETQMCQRH